MNTNVKSAFNSGKVIYLKSIEPRYYKKEKGTIQYSDDLKTWKQSNVNEKELLNSCDNIL